MNEAKELKLDQTVNQINVVHDFEAFVKSVFVSYKNSIGLSSISEEQLLSMLLEQKKDKQYKALKTLIQTRDLISFKQWVDKTQ